MTPQGKRKLHENDLRPHVRGCMAQTTLINVSNRLPVTLKDGQITKSSGGLVAALEGLDRGRFELRWLGWPGEEIKEEKRSEIEHSLVREHGCIPVFLSSDNVKAHYE